MNISKLLKDKPCLYNKIYSGQKTYILARWGNLRSPNTVCIERMFKGLPPKLIYLLLLLQALRFRKN